jgi:transcriptional regulator GlxA family with amidase domain
MFNTTRTLFLFLVASSQLALAQQPDPFPATTARLAASAKKGRMKVAFVLTDDAVMIDFAGPWEVFQDVMLSGGASMNDMHVFDLYVVSDSRKPIHASDGMRIIPDYTFDDAPQPNIVVVPAQSGKSPKMMDWIRRQATRSDIVMSVCTGAYRLAQAGLLEGKKAATHHDAWDDFQSDFPNVKLQRNVRWVQSDSVIFMSGGLSSGIDLALHVVELYFGRDVAENTARIMEYQGIGWRGDGSANLKIEAAMEMKTK